MSGASQQFRAKHAELAAVRRFVEATCSGIGHDACQRIMLLVEELFANTVVHGYGGDCDEPVWLTLVLTDHGCRVIYEDRAPPHDPFDGPRTDVSAPVEERPVGALGILLLAELTSTHRYQRRNERNVIELEVARAPRH